MEQKICDRTTTCAGTCREAKLMHDQQLNIKPENINPGNPLNIGVHRENQVDVWLNFPLPSLLVERWEKRG